MTNFDVWWKHVPIEPKELKKAFEFHARTAWALGISEAMALAGDDPVSFAALRKVRNETAYPTKG